jgi:hypothetical protein
VTNLCNCIRAPTHDVVGKQTGSSKSDEHGSEEVATVCHFGSGQCKYLDHVGHQNCLSREYASYNNISDIVE